MEREHIEELNADPAWVAAYRATLVNAEELHGEGLADALSYAVTAADMVIANTAHQAADLGVTPSPPRSR